MLVGLFGEVFVGVLGGLEFFLFVLLRFGCFFFRGLAV